MSTKTIIILLIGLCAIVSLLEGFACARKALKQDDKTMSIFAAVFIISGMVLTLCLSNI